MKWADGTEPSEAERRDVSLLREAGCKCSLPLLGYRPEVGPRCRLCNTTATETVTKR